MIKRTAVALALLLPPAAFAQTSIVSDGDCGAVTLHVTSHAGADRVALAYVHEPKQRVAVTPVVNGGTLDFNADVPANEVVMASVELKPVVSGNETQTEHAKAFVFCGATAPRADWQRSAGLALELYPQGWNGPRPEMKPGDTMRFIAVDKSTRKLLGDLPMTLRRTGGGLVADGTPAKDGGMNFIYPAPGRYTVVATYRRPDPLQPEHWLVDTSTLTFDVK